jgi:hypothetical protein
MFGCTSQEEKTTLSSMDVIQGRDNDGPRFAVYRIRVPDAWIRRDPLPNESLIDTTKSLCDYIIRDEDGTIRIFIHNFPTQTMEERIPPAAQVARWQRQFDSLIPHASNVVPQAFSGYSGLLFTGVGTLKNEPTMVMGWALQIASEHYRTLSHPDNPLNKQMRADVTIKAVGPVSLMEKYQGEIKAFARSFELIEEIGTP